MTGVMKIAHAAEGFGLDAEPHAPGPSRRHVMAAIRNCNYYEMGLIHPRIKRANPPVYIDYEDELDAIDSEGCVTVPTGHGMGVKLDWDFIAKNKVASKVYE